MKSFYLPLLIIILSLLPFVSIFTTNQLPHTSDGGVQIPRMAAFYTALKDGHIPVRWAGNLNYGYGLPLFNFIYHTPFFISSFLIWLGIGLIDSFKLLLLISFLLSGIFMFLFSSVFFKDTKTALFVTMLYQFAPYRLVEILTRGSIGGIYAYTFLPLMLWCIVLVWNKATIYRILGIIIAGGLLILSHNALALLFFFCVVLFILLMGPNKPSKYYSLFGVLGSLGLSAYYWIPALFEHKYTYGDLFMKDLYLSHFPEIFKFFIPNLINAQNLRVAEINIHIGITHTVVFIIACLVLITTKQMLSLRNFIKEPRNRLLVYSISIFFLSIFFMSRFSVLFWQHISFLRQFQFPWRFLALTVFSTSLMGSFVMSIRLFRQRYIFVLLLLLTIVPTLYYWRPPQGYTYGATDEKFWNYPLNTTYFGETDVIWSAGPATSYPPSRIQIADGNAQISNFSKKTHQQFFTVEAIIPSTIVSNTQYFPGWKVYVDDQLVPIEFQDQNWRGLITFAVPQGIHQVKILFKESKIRILADCITLGTIVIMGISLLASTRLKRLTRKNV